MRYFYQATDALNTTTYVNGHLSGTTAICTSTHPVTMRSSPTVTYSGGNFLVYTAASSTTKTDLGTQTSPVSFRTLASSISGSSGNACHIDFSGGTINYSSEL